MTAPTPQPGILEIAPYVPGKSGPAGAANQVTKLSANENPFGPSPDALTALRDAAADIAIYPKADHTELREAIAEVHGLDPARMVCGAGSDELITLLCQAYAGPGKTVLHTEHGFSMYPICARAHGATPVSVPEQERRADVDALLAAVDARTAIVFLANPNNPTGTMLEQAEIQRLADGLPDDVILALDGAYVEYVEGYDGGAALVEARENVVMTRTFSKIYGLGGLRVGWGYMPPAVADVLNRIRAPFNVSALGITAGAVAVRDQAYIERCKAANAEWRDLMVAELNAIGLPTDQSFANFVLPRFPSADAAAAADRALAEEGLIVRNVSSYGLPEYLRITVGDEVACRRVLGILREFMSVSA